MVSKSGVAKLVVLKSGPWGKDIEIVVERMYFYIALGLFEESDEMNDKEYFSKIRIYYPIDSLYPMRFGDSFVKSLTYYCDTKKIVVTVFSSDLLSQYLNDDLKDKLQNSELDIQSLQKKFEEMAGNFDDLELYIPNIGFP